MPPTRVRLALPLILTGFCLVWGAGSSHADELVLRNLKVVRNCKIASVDVDGIRVDQEIDGLSNPLSWDLILRATLAEQDAEKSAAIKEFSQSVGAPLARLKARFIANDRLGLLEPAQTLYATLKGRATPDNLLALIGLMRGHIAQGTRERAVPFAIEALRLQNAAKMNFSVVPGKPPAVDSQTGLFEELPPVWLDPDAAKEAWRELEPQLDEQSFGGKAESNSDAVWVYAASLAIAGGDAKKGESILSKVSGQENWAVSLVQAELNFATDRVGQAAGILTTIAPKVSQSSRCWLALVQGKVTAKQMKPTDDNAALMLELLRGPALHAQDQPELAAGCLEQAIALTTIAEDSKSAQILKGELQRAFPLTVAARRNR